MTRRLSAVYSNENQLSRCTLTPKQASATAARLLQWKKRNDAQREVKARLQEDERIEEEEYFLSLSKALPLEQVQAAATRNYQAAGELRWKKLMLRTIAEKQQLDDGEAECTFRPKLVARIRRHANSSTTARSKPCTASCAAVTAASTSQLKGPSGGLLPRRHRSPTDGDVFDRLYKPQACRPSTPSGLPQTIEKRISSQAEAAFIARQERDQVNRQRRQSELAAQQRLPHKPRLSRYTQELCAAQRDTDGRLRQTELLRSEQKGFISTKQVRYTIPPCTDTSKHANVASRPFHLLIEALHQQEQYMRRISKCA